MADYHIYIHSQNGGGQNGSNRTKPWATSTSSSGATSTAGGGKEQTTNWASKISSGINKVANMEGMIGTGVSALMKAVPWLAVAYAVYKIADKVYATALDFTTPQTGDYKALTDYQNYKTAINSVLHPITTTLTGLKVKNQWQVQNYKQEQNRELLGDSLLNSHFNRGV